MSDNVVDLKIRVNAETGGLEVVGAKFSDLANQANKVGSSFGGLSGAAGSLLKSFLPFASAAGVVAATTAYLQSSIKTAEDYRLTLDRIKFSMENLGGSWEANRKNIIDWSETLQRLTRFSNDEALKAFDQLYRVTGNVGQAQKATQLAMGISVKGHMDMSTAVSHLADLLNGQTRSLISLNREFGGTLQGTQDAQVALDRLSGSFLDGAINEEGLTKKSADLKNAWDDLSRSIGTVFSPAVTKVIELLTDAVNGVGALFITVKGNIKIYTDEISGYGEAIAYALSGKFKEAQTQIKITQMQMKVDAINMANEISAAYQQNLPSPSNPPLKAKPNKNDVDESKKNMDKIVAINKQGDYNLSKEEFELNRERIRLNRETAFEIANNAIQTFITLNELGEKGSAADRTRAKALLAIQQAIAIGWAWANAYKAGPLGHILAGAETALIVANFAKQSKAIDQAASQEAQGMEAINTRSGVPGIDINAPSGGGGSSGSYPSISSSGGGGGGGGGGTVISVGGITINFDVDRLAVDNVQEVMRKIADKVKQGTVDGVMMAVAIRNAGNKNQKLAV